MDDTISFFRKCLQERVNIAEKSAVNARNAIADNVVQLTNVVLSAGNAMVESVDLKLDYILKENKVLTEQLDKLEMIDKDAKLRKENIEKIDCFFRKIRSEMTYPTGVFAYKPNNDLLKTVKISLGEVVDDLSQLPSSVNSNSQQNLNPSSSLLVSFHSTSLNDQMAPNSRSRVSLPYEDSDNRRVESWSSDFASDTMFSLSSLRESLHQHSKTVLVEDAVNDTMKAFNPSNPGKNLNEAYSSDLLLTKTSTNILTAHYCSGMPPVFSQKEHMNLVAKRSKISAGLHKNFVSETPIALNMEFDSIEKNKKSKADKNIKRSNYLNEKHENMRKKNRDLLINDNTTKTLEMNLPSTSSQTSFTASSKFFSSNWFSDCQPSSSLNNVNQKFKNFSISFNASNLSSVTSINDHIQKIEKKLLKRHNFKEFMIGLNAKMNIDKLIKSALEYSVQSVTKKRTLDSIDADFADSDSSSSNHCLVPSIKRPCMTNRNKIMKCWINKIKF